MKHILFVFVAGLISALTPTNGAFAQTSNLLASKDLVNNYFKIGNAEVSNNPNIINLEMVNVKALKNFRKQYKVSDEKWSQGINCITASYVLDSMNETVYFSEKGNWEASLKTYQEDIMPVEIRKMIKQQYYDYKIIVVSEIETFENKGNPVYLVTLEDANHIKEIRIQGNVMDVYKDFIKR
ncbi:MAG: hypothetical protein ABI266_10535 [Ginsengibacter sp.]